MKILIFATLFALLTIHGAVASTLEFAPKAHPSKPVLSLDDFVKYNCGTHEYELTPAAFKKAQAYGIKVPLEGLPFILRVDGEVIYSGVFWNSLSSFSPKIPNVVLDLTLLTRIQFIGPKAKDPRSNPKVIEAFRTAGKLVGSCP